LKISNSDWAILSDIVCLLVFRIPLAEKVGNIVPPTRDGVSQKVNSQVMELDAADGLDDDMVYNPTLIPLLHYQSHSQFALKLYALPCSHELSHTKLGLDMVFDK
jgi:hypothetical protein